MNDGELGDGGLSMETMNISLDDFLLVDANQRRGNIGFAMREARIQQGLTQRELADRLHIHQADISRAERCVTDQYFPAICRELGLDRHSFMRASADAPRSEAQFSVAELAYLHANLRDQVTALRGQVVALTKRMDDLEAN
jgi:transcriptional regulator with XRE-family HTH domain